MSQGTGIEWTDCTWNPVAGCAPVSAGCAHCYAVTMTHRLGGIKATAPKYAGLTVLQPNGRRHFNGTVRCDEKALPIPLKWRKPRKVFVNSMSDLFHKDVPFEFIDRVFAVMALCPEHTFQILTKRPERMAEYLNRPGGVTLTFPADVKIDHATGLSTHGMEMRWPLPNVWLGTSVENQKAADERIPHLLRCPAAVRFLSCEPLLGGLNLDDALYCLPGRQSRRNGIHWVIAGGESGPGSRPCNVAWIRSLVEQCRAAGVGCFVKQLGGNLLGYDERCWRCGHSDWGAFDGGYKPGLSNCNVCEADSYRCRDPKGGDESEWPVDLRVREFPGVSR